MSQGRRTWLQILSIGKPPSRPKDLDNIKALYGDSIEFGTRFQLATGLELGHYLVWDGGLFYMNQLCIVKEKRQALLHDTSQGDMEVSKVT